MPAGEWAFLQEYVIYEYLMHRFQENNLRLKLKVKDSKPILKDRYLKVKYFEEVKNGYFPDIDLIEFVGDKKGKRPAEVKFTTSIFDYHRSTRHKNQFEDFISENGCIIVLRHDYLPATLIRKSLIDVYEIDLIDFVSFAKENFVRLLNRQIRLHSYKKTWLMIQSKNFNNGTSDVPPAKVSGRWCPIDSLSGLDLGIGDKIIFVKTKGSSKQNVNKYWSRYNAIYDKWILDELYIGEITSQIRSREEYYVIKNIPPKTPLWYDETIEGKNDKRITKRKNKGERWKRVFEFKHRLTFSDLNINMVDLHNNHPEFVRCVIDIFIGQGSREISQDLYTSLIEFIAERELSNRDTLPTTFDTDDSQSKNDFFH